MTMIKMHVEILTFQHWLQSDTAESLAQSLAKPSANERTVPRPYLWDLRRSLYFPCGFSFTFLISPGLILPYAPTLKAFYMLGRIES